MRTLALNTFNAMLPQLPVMEASAFRKEVITTVMKATNCGMEHAAKYYLFAYKMVRTANPSAVEKLAMPAHIAEGYKQFNAAQ